MLKFLRENVLQAVGECMNAGNTSSSVAQRPGKTVFWHLDTHPGKGCSTLGHVGLVRAEGTWVDGWVEMGLDVFSVIVPD